MLLLRLQDPLGEGTSGGLFGEKVFAFCDNLDTVNRLFSSLLSAEGRRPNAAVDAQNRPLALLRSKPITRRRIGIRETPKARTGGWSTGFANRLCRQRSTWSQPKAPV